MGPTPGCVTLTDGSHHTGRDVRARPPVQYRLLLDRGGALHGRRRGLTVTPAGAAISRRRVYFGDMRFQRRFLPELPVAPVAGVLGVLVRGRMREQVAFLQERLVADLALVRPVARVTSLMVRQRERRRERLVAHGAAVRTFARMYPPMLDQRRRLRKRPSADATLKRPIRRAPVRRVRFPRSASAHLSPEWMR